MIELATKKHKNYFKYQVYFPELPQADDLGYVHGANKETQEYYAKYRMEFMKIGKLRSGIYGSGRK